MSRTTTSNAPQTGKSILTPPPSQQPNGLPPEKVAARAYQKWLQGGCKHGCDKQNWFEAEQELKAELARTGSTAARR
jgi:Protein of unknown function (DUF2934)